MGDKFITILEGQMGHGKSNLLNAFYWCLFGQFWDSDKAMLIDDPNPNDFDLFNKGELSENKTDGRSATLFVEIEFYDDSNSKYTLKRSQGGVYINNDWKFEKNSKIELEKIDADTGEYKKYSPDESIGEVQKFFPRSLSNYFLFRGENRAQLVKLQGKEEFQSALKELSKIEMFNRAEIHLSAVLDDFRTELAKQASADIKAQMERLLGDKRAANTALSDYDERLENLKTIEQQKKDDYDYFKNKIKENQTAYEFQVKKEAEEKQIEDIRKQIKGLNDTKKIELTRRWSGMAVASILDEVEEQYKIAVNSGHYPPDISQTLVDKILHDLTCICGTHFDKKDEIFEKITKLKEIGAIDAKLIHEIEALIHESSRTKKLMSSFPEVIKGLDQNIRELLTDIKAKQTIIKGYESKIGKIDFSLDELQKKQQEANDEYNKTHEKIIELKGLIKTKKKELDDIETELQKTESKLDKSNLPAVKVELAEKALNATKELKKKFENSIYDDLEKYTQENWEILVYDKLNYDTVKLLRESMYFEVYDKNGLASRGSMNTGHSILLVLSFISSLIKLAKQVWEEDFPLVLDAPLSEIGDSAMPKALLGFGKVFNQTIIILKDGSVDPVYNQIKDKVGKRYWIELDKNKQHSKIKEVTN